MWGVFSCCRFPLKFKRIVDFIPRKVIILWCRYSLFELARLIRVFNYCQITALNNLFLSFLGLLKLLFLSFDTWKLIGKQSFCEFNVNSFHGLHTNICWLRIDLNRRSFAISLSIHMGQLITMNWWQIPDSPLSILAKLLWNSLL